MNSMENMPDELLVYMFTYLSMKTITSNVMFVCKTWASILRDNLYWTQLLKRDFPSQYENMKSDFLENNKGKSNVDVCRFVTIKKFKRVYYDYLAWKYEDGDSASWIEFRQFSYSDSDHLKIEIKNYHHVDGLLAQMNLFFFINDTSKRLAVNGSMELIKEDSSNRNLNSEWIFLPFCYFDVGYNIGYLCKSQSFSSSKPPRLFFVSSEHFHVYEIHWDHLLSYLVQTFQGFDHKKIDTPYIIRDKDEQNTKTSAIISKMGHINVLKNSELRHLSYCKALNSLIVGTATAVRSFNLQDKSTSIISESMQYTRSFYSIPKTSLLHLAYVININKFDATVQVLNLKSQMHHFDELKLQKHAIWNDFKDTPTENVFILNHRVPIFIVHRGKSIDLIYHISQSKNKKHQTCPNIRYNMKNFHTLRIPIKNVLYCNYDSNLQWLCIGYEALKPVKSISFLILDVSSLSTCKVCSKILHLQDTLLTEVSTIVFESQERINTFSFDSKKFVAVVNGNNIVSYNIFSGRRVFCRSMTDILTGHTLYSLGNPKLVLFPKGLTFLSNNLCFHLMLTYKK